MKHQERMKVTENLLLIVIIALIMTGQMSCGPVAFGICMATCLGGSATVGAAATVASGGAAGPVV